MVRTPNLLCGYLNKPLKPNPIPGFFWLTALPVQRVWLTKESLQAFIEWGKSLMDFLGDETTIFTAQRNTSLHAHQSLYNGIFTPSNNKRNKRRYEGVHEAEVLRGRDSEG